MNLAETKKLNNISEYIIYMYQTEDLIRAYEFDLNQINTYVISHIPDERARKDMLLWYADLIKTMQDEGIDSTGHLSSVRNYRDHLDKLKEQLLSTDDTFKEIFDKAKSFIDENISLSNGSISSDIQICLNGVYGLLLARINGKEISEEVMKQVNAFGDVLSYLSYKFKQSGFLGEN